MDTGHVVLEHAEAEGERVCLRPISVGDAQACFDAVHGVPAITDWITWDGPESVAELEESYSNWHREPEDKDHYTFAIIERSSGAFAGSIGVRHRREQPLASLGYLVGVEFQGRGLASEAVRLATELGFWELGVLLMRAEVFEGNQPSIRVLEKVGYRLDDVEEQTFEKNGVEVPMHEYSISRAVWERAPAGPHAWTTRVRKDA